MHTGFVARLEHDRPGTVAEEDTGATIRPVENARKRFRTDHQRTPVRSGTDELVGNSQGIDEAAADGLQIEGRPNRS